MDSDRGRESSAGLPRLPPGRHGLPREVVARNQRDRISAGAIAAITEHGYHETTIAQIAAAAGVSRRTFYAQFSSKQECYIDVFDQIAAHLSEVATEATAGQEEWPRQVGDRLGAWLEVFAANPRLAVFLFATPPRAGGEIAAHYRRWLDRALTELTEAIPAASEPPPEAVRRSLLGGIVAVVVGEAESDDGGRIAELAPDITSLFLAPYTASLSL